MIRVSASAAWMVTTLVTRHSGLTEDAKKAENSSRNGASTKMRVYGESGGTYGSVRAKNHNKKNTSVVFTASCSNP